MRQLVFCLFLAGCPSVPASGVQHLQRMNIDTRHVAIAGVSHAGDFAHQVHVAFSGMVTGTCVFSGQPYHCAVTRFSGDAQVVQTPESSVPRCEGCDPGKTLIYDHCKNHPEWVDVGKLPDYIRRSCGQNPITSKDCIDDPAALSNATVFLFRPTHDRCYLEGAVANVQALYFQFVTEPNRRIKFVNDQPFPHVLPRNSTPYFNSSTPAGYDGPGECLRWLYGNYSQGFQYAVPPKEENVVVFDQIEFIRAYGLNGTGVAELGLMYVPDSCKSGSIPCKMIAVPNNCGQVYTFQDVDWDWAAYGEANDIIVVKACIGGYVDAARYPNSAEVQRGLFDVYGQLSDDYSWQSAPHMRLIGSILKRIIYGE